MPPVVTGLLLSISRMVRPDLTLRFGKIGFGEIGFGEIGFGKIGFGEIGFGKIGFGEIGFGEIGGHHSALTLHAWKP